MSSTFRGSTFSLKNEQVRMSLLENEEFHPSSNYDHHEDIPYADDGAIFEPDSVLKRKSSLFSAASPAQSNSAAVGTKPIKSSIFSLPSPVRHQKLPAPISTSNSAVGFFRGLISCVLGLVLLIPFLIGFGVFLVAYLIFGVCLRACVALIVNSDYVSLVPISRVFGSGGGNQSAILLVCGGDCNILKIQDCFMKVIQYGGEDSTGSKNRKKKFDILEKRVGKRWGYLCLEGGVLTSPFEIRNHVKFFEKVKKDPLTSEDIVSYLDDQMWKSYGREDSDRIPQWEALLIPRFVSAREDTLVDHQYQFKRPNNNEIRRQDTYAILLRFHNGLMSWKMAQELLLEVLGRSSGRVESPFEYPSWNKLAIWTKIKLVFLESLLGAPKTFLRKLIWDWPQDKFEDLRKKSTGMFSVGLSKSMRLQTLEDIQELSRTSNEAVLNSLVRISVRNLVMGQGLPMLKKMTVSRVFRNGNEDIGGVDTCTTHYGHWNSILQRLHTSYLAIAEKQASLGAQRWFNSMMIWLASAFPVEVATWIHEVVVRGDVLVEIWPSSDEPCFIFGDDLVMDMYGWSGNVGMGADYKFTVTSYCGRVRAGVIGKVGILSNGISGAQIVANEIGEEFECLGDTTFIPQRRLFLN